VTTVSCQYKP